MEGVRQAVLRTMLGCAVVRCAGGCLCVARFVPNDKTQQGNVLVSSLLMLLAMNLLGVALVNASVKEVRTASLKTINSAVFHITESCSYDAINWLSALTAPETDDYIINQDDLDYMLSGNETQDELNKLNGYSFGCTVTPLINKTSDSGTGAGVEIGSGEGYGSSSETVLKYYYQIISIGAGPKNSTKTTNTIASVRWE